MCFWCHKFGHFSNKCPNGAKVVTKDASNDNVEKLISTLEIDTDADYLFEGSVMVANESTKRYLEAALGKPTQAKKIITVGQSSEEISSALLIHTHVVYPSGQSVHSQRLMYPRSPSEHLHV